MADLDPIALISIIMMVVSGCFVFFGVPIILFLLKDRLSFWPRQKWNVHIYEGEIKEIPVYEDVPLLDQDGEAILDAKKRPVTNKKQVRTEKQVVFNEKPEIVTTCWKIKNKIIPWVWVDRGMLKGFKLDLTYLAYNAPIDANGNKAIRLIHLSKGVWEGGSFYPIGQPDMTILDDRTTIFSHKIDKETINQSISAMEAEAWTDFQKNRARKDEDGLAKILQMMAPVFIVVIVLVAIIFTLDYANKSQERSSAIWTQNAQACAVGYTYMNTPKETNTTTQSGPAPIKLPFG